MGTMEDAVCRSYGTSEQAMQVAEDYIAGSKSRYREVVKGAEWSNDVWTIQFSTTSGGPKEPVFIKMLPDGEIVECSARVPCAPRDESRRIECPGTQMRLVTKQQALEIAESFFESQNIRPDAAHSPEILSSPGWTVSVELEPPMPGGHYTLVISPDWEILRIIPGL
jgi:hypothetical protein